MTLEDKLKTAFELGYSVQFQNEVIRHDGEWYRRIKWKHTQPPSGRLIKQCEWFGFDNIEECVDDYLEYIKTNP
jgi:hypothetical protein